MNIEVIFTAKKFVVAAGEYLGILESISSKMDKLLQADLQTAKRLIEQASNSQDCSALLRDARVHLTRSISLVEGPELAVSHIGLAMCQWHLGEPKNARLTLTELININYTDRVKRSFDLSLKSLAMISLLAILILILLGGLFVANAAVGLIGTAAAFAGAHYVTKVIIQYFSKSAEKVDFDKRWVPSKKAGWIVVYDAEKSDWMESPMRWVVMHPESQAATCCATRDEAAKIMTQVAAQGGGFLREAESRFKEAPAKAKRKAATKKQTRQPAKKKATKAKRTASKKGKTKTAAKKKTSRSKAKTVTGEIIPPEKDQSLSVHAPAYARNENEISQNLLQHLEKKFPNEWIAEKIRKMAKAEKSWVNKNGEVITAPDQSTRLKAIELILKYKIGNPRMREEIEVKQGLSMDDLKRMATRSPMFAKALREVLQTVETG